MATTIHELESYLESFSGFESSAAGKELPWLRVLRRNAFDRFLDVGFPTTHDEDWRFTNVSAIARNRFALAPKVLSGITRTQLEPWRIEGAVCRIVFINGHFAKELSTLGGPPGGVAITGLADALKSDSQVLEEHLGRYLDQQRDSFSALNTAFAEDGAFVHIPRGVVVEAPIHFLFVSTSGETPSMNHPRNLIVAEEASQATVVEDYVSLDTGVTFSNAVTELVAGEGAALSHYMIERESLAAFNVSTLRIQQERNASVDSHSLLLGGALVRNNVHPVLAGEGGDCLINGLFIGSDRQHLDNFMLVEHAAPRCGSRQFYNGILDGHAHGVFHGRIIVHKPAQKTDAKQTNRNLLLSDDAQIDTKPQLEIYADDVKCTHGATIGKIEDDALFYLRSRGIDEASARRLLLLAFAGECMERMKQGPVREHITGLVHNYVRHLSGSKP